MYVASVSSGCCKNRSVIAHVAMRPLMQLLGCRRAGEDGLVCMRVGSGGGASGLNRPDGTAPTWARETEQAWERGAGANVRLDIHALAIV
jgi:hypothetical protein